MPNLKVSNVVREVVRLGFGGIDNKFEDKSLIRDILLSRTDVDYLTLGKTKFLALEFEHIAFHGTGRRLIQKHLGPLWQETKEDYELFIADILGDHLFYSFFNAENGQTDVEEASDECNHTIRRLLNNSLSQELKRSLSTVTKREEEVVALFFGLSYFLADVLTVYGRSVEKIQSIEESYQNRNIPGVFFAGRYESFIERISECMVTGEGLELEEIAEIFDLQKERVRQIKERAIRRLKHTARSWRLKEYLSIDMLGNY